MTLRSAIRRTAVGLSLICAGCATFSPGGGSLLSRMSTLRSSEKPKDLPDQQEPESTLAANESPAERDSSDLRATSIARTQPSAQPFDPATMMLIETELRDCPPAERQQWMDLLQSIDPASVPHALQARRMQASTSANAKQPQGQPSVGTPGNPYGRGHSATSVTAGAPRLDFEALDSDADAAVAPSAGFASRLNAPEPTASGRSVSGVSPFGRGQELHRESVPTVQTGFLTRTDARPESSTGFPETGDVGFPQSTGGSSVMPAIAPNQPGQVPLDRAVGGDGRVEPLGRLDILPSNAPPISGQGGAGLTSATLQGAYWQDTLQRLTSLVETEAAATQPGLSDSERLEYVKQQVWLRMLYLMAEQPQRAQSAIPGIDPSEQEFWTALFWAVSNYFDGQTMPDSQERAALTLEQLDYAQNRLQQIAALQLRNVSFCYKINSFGNFESWSRDEFSPGQTVLLYAEISNFESRPNAEGYFMTRLKSDIEIRRGRADGERVETNSLPVTEDACRSIRQDYFHSYTIDLPQNLTPGPYTLILRVEDEFSGKTAVHPISFLIR